MDEETFYCENCGHNVPTCFQRECVPNEGHLHVGIRRVSINDSHVQQAMKETLQRLENGKV